MKVLILFIIPKNSGLKFKANEIIKELNLSGDIIEIRGEDIPCFISKLIKENKKVIGITGEDLFKEFLLSNRDVNLKIIKRIKWEDSDCIFQKPTLCLLGSKNNNFDDLKKELKICINAKYKKLAKKTCTNLLENKGYRIEKIYVSGATEEFFSKGLVDLVIDIVCSGKSAEKAGLKVYDKLFESDLVLIGGKKEKFDFQALYNIINNKINNNDKNSFTKKLIKEPELLKRKIIEEAGEVITTKTKEELIWEFSDIFYFLIVYMALNKITFEDIYRENERRNKETLINKEKLNKLKEGVN